MNGPRVTARAWSDESGWVSELFVKRSGAADVTVEDSRRSGFASRDEAFEAARELAESMGMTKMNRQERRRWARREIRQVS